MPLLENKIAIVTGGAGQIGTGVVRALADAGADVAIVDINTHAAEDLAVRLREGGQRAIALSGDLTEREQCASVVGQAVEEFGGVDILVNLAQQFRAFIPFIEVSDDDMLVSWESGVLSTVRMMQLCHPHLVARGGGAIVNFGSGGGTAGTEGMLAYGLAKEGIRLVTKVGAWEWGPAGIRVNTTARSPTTRRSQRERLPSPSSAPHHDAGTFLKPNWTRCWQRPLRGSTALISNGFSSWRIESARPSRNCRQSCRPGPDQRTQTRPAVRYSDRHSMCEDVADVDS